MRRLDRDWIPRPHAAHLIVTFRCNLRCTGCGSWRVREHSDLTTAEWLDVFDQLRSLDVVKILGGEPFVRQDITALLAGVRRIIDPYILQLTTNGMLTERVVEAVEAVGWPGLQLRISVDGTEATHDRMRGMAGSWRQVVRTVERVAALKARLGFRFGINFAITDQSIDEVEEMIDFAQQHGADLIPGVNVDPFLVGTIPPEVQQPRVIMISDKEKALQALLDARLGTHTQLPMMDRLLSRWMTRRTFEKQLYQQTQRFHCRELRDLLYLLPSGDVVRCGLDHRRVGSLRQQRFDDLWFGEDSALSRQRVDDCPGCLQASVQILSRLYGGCLLS